MKQLTIHVEVDVEYPVMTTIFHGTFEMYNEFIRGFSGL